MSIRPVDLQQVMAKVPDVGHETANQQQQALAGQQAVASEGRKQAAERVETVSQSDETGTSGVHEREAQADSGQHSARHGQAGAEDGDPALAEAPMGAVRPGLGRHVDMQA